MMLTILKACLLPPGLFIVLLLILLVARHYCAWVARQTSWGIAIITMACYALSLPYAAVLLAKPLQQVPAINLTAQKTKNAQAIVVLGGGLYQNAPEYHGDFLASSSMLRLLYAVYLAKQLHLPLVLSGGTRTKDHTKNSEAQIMQSVLSKLFSMKEALLEAHSQNTHDNAVLTVKLLKAHHIKHIILVTHATHMPRALYAFKQQGIDVIPAPTYYITLLHYQNKISYILPNAKAFYQSNRCLYEYLANIWYRL